jgi:hypothetical protein
MWLNILEKRERGFSELRKVFRKQEDCGLILLAALMMGIKQTVQCGEMLDMKCFLPSRNLSRMIVELQ